MSLSLEQRLKYLSELRDVTGPEERIDPRERQRRFLLLPQHKEALEPSVLVIRGERGAGKTALFHFLSIFSVSTEKTNPAVFSEERMRRFGEQWGLPSSWKESQWLVGFSEEGIEHPSPWVLSEMYKEHRETPEWLRHFWFGSLAGSLGKWVSSFVQGEQKERLERLFLPFGSAWRAAPMDPLAWVKAVRPNLPMLFHFLDEIDGILERDGRYLFVVYDQLDRIDLGEQTVRREFIKILLQIWQSFASRYRHLRAKIFLREDLYQALIRSYTDAGKLENLSCSMHWSVESLYRVLYRRMLASDPLREWLQAHEFPLGKEGDPEWGASPPPLPPETENVAWPFSTKGMDEYPQGTGGAQGAISQLALATAMIGRTMGAGVNKGYVHRWIPNHLSDANNAIVPRSMLNLFSFAARYALMQTPKAQDRRLLHPTELMEGLKEASAHRMKELQEEYPFVQRLRALRGITLFSAQEEIEERLSVIPLDGEDDGYGRDGKRVFAELERLGVFKDRGERGVDMPDLYRLGLEIKRRGGMARASA